MLTETITDVKPSDKDQLVKATFHVHFQADPNTLPRLLEPFAKHGLIPDRIFSDREAHADRALNFEVRLFCVKNRLAKNIENTLRSVIGVRRVIAVMEILD